MATITRNYLEPFFGLVDMNVVNYQNRDNIVTFLKITIKFSFKYVSNQ
jgi:hypothetical protein